MRAARSADSRASAVRSAADDDPSAAAVVVEDVPDIRVDEADADADPGGGLFTALAALCDILLLVFAAVVVVVVVVAYPRPIAAIAKQRSVPLALRPQCSAHIRLS